jgi:hypothetical protein
MANDNWDFSAYDMDLSKLDKVAEKPVSIDGTSFDLPVDNSVDHESPEKHSSEVMESVYTQAKEKKPAEDHPQTVNWRPDTPKKEPSITNKELAELIEKTDKLTDMVNAWSSQLSDIRDNAKERLPKGIRISIHRLHEVTDVFMALMTILETVSEEVTPEILLALEENKLPSCCNRTASNFERHDRRMNEMTKDLKEAVDTDDPEARTKARELKTKVLSIHSDTVTLAETMTQFVQAYPEKHEELALFSMIAATGDEEKMEQIDRAIMVTDQFLVLVADAPAMIKAQEEKDSEAMTNILSRMIDKRSEKRI